MKNIVEIGAGLVVARQLEDKFKVIVFEKFCGVGGCLARRYAEDVVFDYGAQ